MPKKKIKLIKSLVLFVSGAVVLESANFSKAESIILENAPVYSTAQVDVEELFEQAMDARDSGRYKQSITAFHDIISADPTLHRARLELAVAYYRNLQFDNAKKQAQTVINDPKTPANVRVSILAFIAQIEKGLSSLGVKHYWRFPVSLAYIYDDNINVGPSSSEVPNLGIPGSVNPNDLPKTDNGKEISIGVSHNYQTGKLLRFGDTTAMFYWMSGVTLFHRGYFNEDDGAGNNYSLNALSFKTGPAAIAFKKWRALLNLQADILQYGGDDLACFYTATPSFTRNFSHGFEATVDLDLSKRQYKRTSDSGRDSDYYAPRLLVGYVTPDSRFAVQGGVQYFSEEADSSRYSNEGLNYFVGLTWNFQTKSSAFASYNLKNVKYEGLEPTFSDPRDEKQHTYTVGVQHTFSSKNTAYDGWTISLKAIRTDNDSNVATTDYDRTQYKCSLSRTF